VVLNHQYKLVYSPHVYGPAVYNQPYFSAGNFPNNMPAIWDAHWGFVAGQTGNAVVIGEWGGTTSGNNGVWLNALASYLQSKGMTDQFWWCLNPNSGDTGGLLLDDWTSPDTAKLNLLASLVPSPSRFSVDTNGQVCLAGTAAASVTPTPSKPAASTKSPTPLISKSATPMASKAATTSPTPSISRSATPSPSKGASRTPTPSTSCSPSASPSRGSSPSRSPVRSSPSVEPVDG
jgi:endoglucanase